MTKLRNIGYLRSDPKSDRASRVELPPSPLLSPSPLSGSRGQEMRVRGKGLSFYIWGGACRPSAGRAGCLPPLHRAAGACRPAGVRQAPARGLRAKKNIFIYI